MAEAISFKTVLSNLHTPQGSAVENCIVIWLDANSKADITRLQRLVNIILLFSDSDRCFDYITDVKHEKIFLIVSDTLGKPIVPFILNFPQIDSIYVFCKNQDINEAWAKKEKKIRGVFKSIESIYDALRRDIRQCEDDLIPFSILSSRYDKEKNNNHADQLFIDIQLMKEILLEMENQPNSKRDFIQFCLFKYHKNPYQSNLIQDFRKTYHPTSAIRWYINEYFTYAMLNKAFRIQDLDILTKMSFFVRDLHQEIRQRHGKFNKQNRFNAYRGQGISAEAFQRILENQNGFLSFNNFFIATTDKEVSITYARFARDSHELTGVLFHMEIDRAQSLFTPLDKISNYPESDTEMLFSTHTIFRISNVQQIENNLWQIQLRLTTNEDGDLNRLKKFIRKEIEGKNQLERLEILRTKFRTIDESETENESQDTEMESKDATDPLHIGAEV